MAKTSAEIIEQFGNKLLVDMQKAIPSATGETAESMFIKFFGTTDTTGFAISGGEQIGAIIDGRKPTSAGASKSRGKTLREKVFEWIKALRIRPRESNMTQLSLSWAISNHIHKHGFKGRGNIFAQVITKSRFDSLTKSILKSEALAFNSNLSKQIKLSR